MKRVLLVLTIMSLKQLGLLGAEEEISLMYTITEEAHMGTLVGNVLSDAYLEEKYSRSDLHSIELVFQLPPPLPLHLNADSGDLFIAGRIDREMLCADFHACVKTFKVIVTPLLEVITVSIRILDINDNSPVFITPFHTIYISESVGIGTVIDLPPATDADTGIFCVQKYGLLSASDKFELNMEETDDHSKKVQLVLINSLDWESKSLYQIWVIAYDGGDPPKRGSMKLTIQVRDANDFAPVFDQDHYDVTVSENIPVHTTIVQVNASDADVGYYGNVVYKFSEETQNEVNHMLNINSKTGEIYMTAALDREDKSMYNLTVIAWNRGSDILFSNVSVYVFVQDINDNYPHITIDAGQDADNTVTIPEDTALQSIIGHFQVTDPDEGRNAEFSCSLDNEMFLLVRTDDSNYDIIINDILKYDRYGIRITCVDGGRVPRTSIRYIHINVVNNGASKVIPNICIPCILVIYFMFFLLS